MTPTGIQAQSTRRIAHFTPDPLPTQNVLRSALRLKVVECIPEQPSNLLPRVAKPAVRHIALQHYLLPAFNTWAPIHDVFLRRIR